MQNIPEEFVNSLANPFRILLSKQYNVIASKGNIPYSIQFQFNLNSNLSLLNARGVE